MSQASKKLNEITYYMITVLLQYVVILSWMALCLQSPGPWLWRDFYSPPLKETATTVYYKIMLNKKKKMIWLWSCDSCDQSWIFSIITVLQRHVILQKCVFYVFYRFMCCKHLCCLRSSGACDTFLLCYNIHYKLILLFSKDLLNGFKKRIKTSIVREQ